MISLKPPSKYWENFLPFALTAIMYVYFPNQICFRNSVPKIIFIIFWNFFMFYQIFFSPEVKQRAIITYKHGIYEVPQEMPQELPNDWRCRKLGNISKVSKLYRMIAKCPVKMKILLILAKNSWKTEIKLFS